MKFPHEHDRWNCQWSISIWIRLGVKKLLERKVICQVAKPILLTCMHLLWNIFTYILSPFPLKISYLFMKFFFCQFFIVNHQANVFQQLCIQIVIFDLVVNVTFLLIVISSSNERILPILNKTTLLEFYIGNVPFDYWLSIVKT